MSLWLILFRRLSERHVRGPAIEADAADRRWPRLVIPWTELRDSLAADPAFFDKCVIYHGFRLTLHGSLPKLDMHLVDTRMAAGDQFPEFGLGWFVTDCFNL